MTCGNCQHPYRKADNLNLKFSSFVKNSFMTKLVSTVKVIVPLLLVASLIYKVGSWFVEEPTVDYCYVDYSYIGGGNIKVYQSINWHNDNLIMEYDLAGQSPLQKLEVRKFAEDFATNHCK
jgi:hypothetical protein